MENTRRIFGSAREAIQSSRRVFLLAGHKNSLACRVWPDGHNLPTPAMGEGSVPAVCAGICGVCGLCSALVHKYRNGGLGEDAEAAAFRWIRYGSGMFHITATYAALVLLLYVFIGSDLTFKLAAVLNKKLPAANETVHRRTGLIKRSLAVLVATVGMTTCSVLYANNPTLGYQCAFALSSAAMGLTIFVCYIILSETIRGSSSFFGKSSILGLEEAYSSESDNSFFTKQEAEAECEAIPPKRSEEEISSCPEEIVLKPLSAPRKSVTFHSDLVTGCSVIEDSSSGSPEKEEGGACPPTESSGGGGGGKRSEERPEARPMPRASHQQNPPSDPALGCLQEVVTTRVCLELGVLNSADSRAPLMVCNVDIEPSTRLLEVIEAPAPAPPPAPPATPAPTDTPHVDVLNRITHDLQFLLNNTADDSDYVDDLKTPL